MEYHIRLQLYEGPLALLVDLIEAREIDIWNIPIAEITEQYLAYLATMEELNLEIGGEFIVMAATLLAIKARMLLPQEDPVDDLDWAEDEAEDPRAELVRRLLEYRQFRDAGRALGERLNERGIVAGRGAPAPPGTVRYVNPVGKATVMDLARAYQRLLESLEASEPKVPLPQTTVTLEERVEQVLDAVRRSGLVPFDTLCRKKDRRFVVVTFLAVLELVRQGAARALQSNVFGPIMIQAQEEQVSS